MIGNLAAVILFRVGVRLPKILGMLPAKYYISEAVRNLRKDDLDGAMACYRTARVKNPKAEEVKVLHEVLLLEMKHRRQALEKRCEVLRDTLAAGRKEEETGNQLTVTFCQNELESAVKALKILRSFADELAGKPPEVDREAKAVN